MKIPHLVCLFALGYSFNPTCGAAADPISQPPPKAGLSAEEEEYPHLPGEISGEQANSDWTLDVEVADSLESSAYLGLQYHTPVAGAPDWHFAGAQAGVQWGNTHTGRSISSGLRLEKNLAGGNTRDYERLGRLGVEKDYRILSANLDLLWRYHPKRRSNLKLWGRSGFGDRLAPQEQAIPGGPDSIRGYPKGQVAADVYYAASLEHQWIMSSRLPMLDRWALSIFAEGGWFKRTGTSAVILQESISAAPRIFPEEGELASVGISSSWQFKHNLELILDYGVVLKQVRESKQMILIAPNMPPRPDYVQRIRQNPEDSVDEGDSEVHLQVKMRF